MITIYDARENVNDYNNLPHTTSYDNEYVESGQFAKDILMISTDIDILSRRGEETLYIKTSTGYFVHLENRHWALYLQSELKKHGFNCSALIDPIIINWTISNTILPFPT